MAMAKKAIRALSWLFPASRNLCAATELADSSVALENAATPEFRPLYRRLSALGGRAGGSVSETMSEWLREGRKVTEVELLNFVRQFRKYKSYKVALELMDWMESQKLVGSHAVRIDLLSKVRGICIAEKFFYSLPDTAKHHQTYGALLACYCSKRMKDKAITLYARMKELGLASGSLVYNNLMSLHLKAGQPEEVQKLFDEMQSCNTLPDKCSYKILIESYALLNDIDSIERIVGEMERNDGALHWSVYCHLAAIYNSIKLFEKARNCLLKAELVINGHDSSPFPYLLSLYAGAGDLLEVKRVWRLLKARIQKSRRPTNLEYLVMLQALKRLDDIDELLVFFEEWESACVSYDLRLVNTVIGAYLENNRVKEAGLLLKKAVEGEGQPIVCTFWLFIDYHLKKGEMDQAQRWSHAASSVVKSCHFELESE